MDEFAQDLDREDQEEEPEIVDDAYSHYESFSPTPYQSPPNVRRGVNQLFGDDLAESKWSTLGHEYQVIDEIWNPRIGNWVPYKKPPPKDYGDVLFVARYCTFAHGDPESAFCLVEFQNDVLTEAVREVVKDLEDLFATRPSTRVSYLFPHLQAIQDRLALLRKQDEEDCSEEPARSSFVTAHVQNKAAYLASFLEFLNAEWEPSKQKLERLLAEGSITFDLLWVIFKPGMMLKITDPISGEMAAARLERTVIHTDRQAQGRKRKRNKPAEKSFKQPVVLHASTMAWNSSSFNKWPKLFTISYFKGPRDISSLDVTELQPADHAFLKERGRKFIKFAGINHVELSGTLFVNLKEMSATGRAMIDAVGSDCEDNLPASSWGDDPSSSEPTGLNFDEIADEDLHLLPATLPGYSFILKEWGDMRVSQIEFAEYDTQAWDHLILDANTKTLIRSLVEVRGDKKKTAQLTSDWIRGKSGGLVFLLHGAPGLGKTLTAETVAEELKRPLYVVSSSELGFEPTSVEPNLRRILQTATIWNAVLLIDEADVLLERRGQYDLQRNALVASVLRLLEYHSGVLFLTTNRVKSFDPAVLSRVSIAIKYAPLEYERRIQIWRHLLFQNPNAVGDKLINTLISEDDLEYLAVHPLNGRVIKNVVRTAQSLALASDVPLAMGHLKAVIDVTNTFLKDMSAIKKPIPNNIPPQ